MSTKHNDDFGDRLKKYEKKYTDLRVDVSKPIYARLDGRSFSKFTKKMERPFDRNMSACMVDVTEFLVKETKASLGYTQSDEISLLWDGVSGNSEFMFDGKIQKLASVLSSMCSAKFVLCYSEYFGNSPDRVPSFDCRILDVPDETEAQNMVLWRQKDAFKNSVQSAAHYFFGHKNTMHKNTREKLKMMADRGIDFFTYYSASFRVGTTIRPVTELRNLTNEELSAIPEKYRPLEPVVRTNYHRSHPVHVEERYVV